jgi:GT2 family glycosyltransferase
MPRSQALHERVGVVAIGRNEGERLRRCLDSISGSGMTIVYVDSDSSDGSQDLARARGVHVVELDLSRAFTAARARNEGFEALMELSTGLEFVFFVDGDCEVVEGFLEQAVAQMDLRRDVAVVCGRRLEKFPNATLYNLLADMEWNTRVGEADSCGGDALMRTIVFRNEGGYDPGLISGEEPELCLRLRRRGFKIIRADLDMTLHDAAMTRFGQWWNRALRTGYAAIERLLMHGFRENRVHLKRVRSSLFWTLGFPLGLLTLAFWQPFELGPLTCAFLYPAGYAVLAARILQYRLNRKDPLHHAAVYALFCMLGKFPELVGMAQCVWQRSRGVEARWIEYKDVAPRQGSASDDPTALEPQRRSA